MKKFALFLVFVVLCKVGYDQFMRSMAQRNARQVDEQMERIADEMNTKMPMVGPLVKVTRVEYAQRVLRFSAVVTGDDLSAQTKTEFTNVTKAYYCQQKMSKQIGVDYEILGPPRSISDLTRESWRLSLRPEHC